jgi:two-component system OmpR family response regulator
MMLEKIWNYHFDPGSNVVDVHIGRLRRKLEEDFDAPILHTVRGAGYRLSLDN